MTSNTPIRFNRLYQLFTYFGTLFLLVICPWNEALAADKGLRPNIVIILADDMGVGDVSALNPDSKITTPAIDQLAREGMIFTDAHSGSAVCTPTRYGLLTGRYCWRTPLKGRVLSGYSRSLISPDRTTIASLLKQQGYTTAMVGKWHLGMTWQKKDGSVVSELKPDSKTVEEVIDFTAAIKVGPRQLGFDSYFGMAASWDMPPYAFIENDRLISTNLVKKTGRILPEPEEVRVAREKKLPAKEIKELSAKYPKASWRSGMMSPDMKATDAMPAITKRAVQVIGEMKKDKPLFLYVSLTAPHTPVVPNEQFKGKSKAGTYGDFVQEVDWTVKEIVEALKKRGVFDNTLLVFTADNGYSPRAFPETQKEAYQHNPSFIYNGAKGRLYEGGHRVPFVATWPDIIKAKSKSKVMICLNDFLATFADMTEVDLPENAGEDSFSFLSALRGENQPTRTTLVSSDFSGQFAIREGNKKLLLSKNTSKHELFDLSVDVSEENRLDKKNPGQVSDLKSTLQAIIENGRETPGKKQPYDNPDEWPQLDWLRKK